MFIIKLPSSFHVDGAGGGRSGFNYWGVLCNCCRDGLSLHTQLLAQTRVRTRGDLVSMYLSRGPCFSRKGCLPRSCAIDQFVCLPVGGRLANLHFGAQRRLKCFLIRRPILRPLIRRPILRPSPRFCRYSGTNSGYTECVSI